MSSDDVELGRRLRAGDASAIAEVQSRFAPAVSAWLLSEFDGRLAPDEIADVMQDALLALWLHGARYDPGRAALRAWFAGIARHMALRRLSRGWAKQRSHETTCETGTLDEIPWRLPGADDEALPARAEGDRRRNGDGDGAPEEISARRRFRAENLPVMTEILAILNEGELAALMAAGEADHRLSLAELAKRLGMNSNSFRSRVNRGCGKVDCECERRSLPHPNWDWWLGKAK